MDMTRSTHWVGVGKKVQIASRQEQDLNYILNEGPPCAGLQLLTGLCDRQSLLVCVIKLVGETVGTVDERTQVITERQTMLVSGLVCAFVLIRIYASPKGHSVAV
jgi:hypothetical protein